MRTLQSRIPGWVALSAAVVAVALSVQSVASATVVTDDFSYTGTAPIPLGGQNGGTGWGGAWSSGSSSIYVHDTGNLGYSAGGYSITQSGTGTVYNNVSGYREHSRVPAANLTGTVWFSILAENPASAYHAGIGLNQANPNDQTQANFAVEISGSSLTVWYNGTSNRIGGVLAVSRVHLLLGRITFQNSGNNDRLDVWADPVSIANAYNGTENPDFSQSDADMGADLSRLSVLAYGVDSGDGGWLDALRASDGGGSSTQALQDATGVSLGAQAVPEPLTLAGLGLAVCGVAGYLRRRLR